jgi:hypothetical protein
MEEYQTFIYTFLAVIVFVLATYLGFLLNKIRIQKKIQELNEKEIELLRSEREQSIKESIRILARAVINKQCEVSEGCLRIKKLLELIELDINTTEIAPIETVYDEIKDFAYLDARDALTKQEKFSQDKQRFAIENKHQDAVVKACEGLLSYLNQ